MKTARNRIGEVMEGWLVVAQPRQHRGVMLYEIQHLCGAKRTVYPQDWQRGFVACRKCKYDRTVVSLPELQMRDMHEDHVAEHAIAVSASKTL